MEATTAVELDAEYRAIRAEAGFLERSRAALLVEGDDAAEFLQGQLTNDVEGLERARGCYAALLDRKGRMQADLRVLRFDTDRFWLDAEPAAVERVVRHLDMYRIGRQVEVEDVSPQRAVISVLGPAAPEASGAGALAPEHAQRRLEGDDIEALAVATDLGIDLIVARDGLDALRARLVVAGAVEVSESAAEVLRVESGRPRFGREMDERTIPQEAGINERAVSFTKGCYIGQETVARLHYKGKPNRHLRGLRLAAPVASGEPVRLGERDLGVVGTALVSPAEGPIALAILRREAEPGSTVTVGDATDAEVVELPFRS